MEQVQSQSSSQNKALNAISKVVGGIETALLWFAGISMAGVLVITILGIVSREFVNRPILWTNDLAGYLLSYSVMLSASWVLREKGHVVVDIIVSHIHGMALRINTFIISLVSAVSFSLFFWFAFQSTLTLYQRGTVMMNNVPWPKYLLIAPLAIGSFFLIIRLIVILLECIWKPEEFEKQQYEEEGKVETHT